MYNPSDKLNPKLLNAVHIGKGNMPTGRKSYGTRTTHWHELDIITWGDGVDHVCGESFPVTCGDVFYRVPGLKNKHDLPYHCYFFVFDPYYDERHESDYQSNCLDTNETFCKEEWNPIPLFSFAKTPYLGKAKDLEKLNILCKNIMMEYSSTNPDTLMMKIMFLNLLHEVHTQLGPVEEKTKPTSNYQQYWQGVQDIKKWIYEHPTEDLSMETMAQRLDLSYSFFSRVFKHITGENFSTCVSKSKLNYIKFQLIETNKSIEEIALECRFSDPNYLYTLFRREIGCTPTGYRILTAKGYYDCLNML